jgi:hypothetical protein
MRVPRVRFTMWRMIVVVAVLSLYLAALHLANHFIFIVWTTPPLLWTAIYAGWRSSAGDAMSEVEWHARFMLGMMVAAAMGIMTLVFVVKVFPGYSK